MAEEAAGYAAPPANILSAMAASGARTDENNPVVPDIKIEEPPAPPPTEKPAVAETATPTPPVPEVNAEIPQATPPPPQREQTPVVDWKQEVKKADMADVLKELGFDDKMLGFFHKWKTEGNIGEYLKAVSTDYSKMTSEQVMKYQLQEDYPEFSSEDLEELYQGMVVDKFKLNPDMHSESEVRRGKLLLAAEAKKIREQLTSKQQEYILSAKPPVQAPNTDAQAQEEQTRQILEQYKNTLTAHPATKELLSNRKLMLGEGDEVFNYEVADPGKALEALQDPVQWAGYVFNTDGTPQVEKQLFLAAAAIDYKTLTRELIKYGKTLGAKQAIEPIENARKPEGQPSGADPGPLTPAQALARAGVMTSNS